MTQKSSKDMAPTMGGSQAAGGVRFGFSNDDLHNGEHIAESMEDEFAVELQDLVSNSEIGDDLHVKQPPQQRNNIQFV